MPSPYAFPPESGTGDYALTVQLDFGGGNHASYRWHIVIPSS